MTDERNEHETNEPNEPKTSQTTHETSETTMTDPAFPITQDELNELIAPTLTDYGDDVPDLFGLIDDVPASFIKRGDYVFVEFGPDRLYMVLGASLTFPTTKTLVLVDENGHVHKEFSDFFTTFDAIAYVNRNLT